MLAREAKRYERRSQRLGDGAALPVVGGAEVQERDFLRPFASQYSVSLASFPIFEAKLKHVRLSGIAQEHLHGDAVERI